MQINYLLTSYPGMTQTIKLNALKRIEDYSGQTDVEQWIDRVEAAMRIDKIQSELEADIIIMRLEGAARSTWKSMPSEKRFQAAAIKAALRSTFGLSPFSAWSKFESLPPIQSNDSIDVAFQETKVILTTACADKDPVSRMAAFKILSRLPDRVREQVVLRCGADLDPTSVIENAKTLMTCTTISDITTEPVLTANVSGRNGHSSHQHFQSRDRQRNNVECFSCGRLGHIARHCQQQFASGNDVGNTGASTVSPVNQQQRRWNSQKSASMAVGQEHWSTRAASDRS